jgi:AraC-like DNA-binding protein/Tfp pilus assembly protein PilF
MKCCLSVLAFLISLSSVGQTLSADFLDLDTTKRDTSLVHAYIKLSKSNQWINSDRSLNYAEQALALSQSLNYPAGIAIAKNLKGFCFWGLGDNDLAVQSAMDALEITQQINDQTIQAESYYILARGYMDLAERAKAREHIAMAEKLATTNKNGEQLCSIYNLKGVILFLQNKPDSALYYYNKAYETGKSYGVAAINFPRIISNIGECYANDNPALAFSNYKKALELANETGNQIAKASITSIIGMAYLRNDDVRNAEENLQTALRLARTLGLRRVVRQAYGGLVDIRLKQNKGSEAVAYLRKYHEVNDSLLNSAKIRQIVELESRHALQLKEQNIQLLEKEKRIQIIWRNLLIGLVLFVILLSVALYLLQQFRHRKNREMLNLEIDYLTRQHRETLDKYKSAIPTQSDELVESQDQRLLKKAIATVEDNISDPLFGVEKMAADMNMSRTSLHRKLKAITGFPPSELIRSIRLRKASRLILNRVDTVSQIALMVGFDDYSHFSKSFKKHFGVAPTNYEEHVKSQSEVEQPLP